MLLLAATTLSAQTAAPAAADTEVDIVVTATKRETRLQDTPAQVNAFSGEYLERSAVREFSDLASSIPNLVAPDGLVGTSVVAIRGISSPAKGGSIAEQPVSQFLDGVFMPEGSLDDLVFDVQQIEVIRGPQGVIWGRNTLAGAISYTTRRPTHELEGYVESGIGNYDAFRLQGAISGPLLADKISVRLAAAHEEQDGYSERVSGGTFGARNREAVRASILFRPVEPLSITLIGDYARSHFTNVTLEYFIGPFAKRAGTDGYTRRQDTDFFKPSRSTSKGLTALLELDLGPATLSSVTGLRRLNQALNIDTDSSDLLIIHDQIDSRVRQFSQEVRLTSSSTGPFRWMAGAYYYTRDQRVLQNEQLGPELVGLPPGGGASVDIDFRNSVDSFAAFGTVALDLTRAITVETGLRVTREEKSTLGSVGTTVNIPGVGLVPVGTDLTDLDLDDTQVSPMATLSYRPTSDVLLYASWGRGNKSGGFNDARVSEPTFAAEVADSYELGIKSEWLEKRLTLNVIGFYIDYRNLQVRGFEGTTPLFRNAKKAVSKGIELEAIARPSREWSLFGNFAYNDATYENFVIPGAGAGGGGLDLSGNKMPLAPRTSMSVGADYRTEMTGLGELYAHAEWNRKSGYFLDFANTRPGGYQPDYGIVNGRLGLALSNGADVSIWVRNLTKADYKVDFIGDLPVAIFGGSQFHLLGAPRTYGVDLKFSF
ncbi:MULTISPECIES: TonB-dependent receptor [Sphingomonas]|nr:MULTISPECIES: TonB-dependent receptor [Sphingomonas]MBA2921067.1 TonB-dependent receptor [Sphingomonas sp. CGMCC 1.13658]